MWSISANSEPLRFRGFKRSTAGDIGSPAHAKRVLWLWFLLCSWKQESSGFHAMRSFSCFAGTQSLSMNGSMVGLARYRCDAVEGALVDLAKDLGLSLSTCINRKLNPISHPQESISTVRAGARFLGAG
jgi:hypothetical protein